MDTSVKHRRSGTEPSFMQRNLRIGVWSGVAGSAVGATAWLLAMAALSGDWLAVALTLVLDTVVVVLFAQMCLRHPGKRFLLLAVMLLVLTCHCLVVYWWRLDLWRADTIQTAVELSRQKKVVTFTVGGMVAILIGQLAFMQWLQQRGKVQR